MDATTDILAKSDVVMRAFIGLDVSFNILEAKGGRNRWQPQAYVIATVTDVKRLRELLKSQFPKSQAVSRPIKIKLFDGSPYAASYALKYQFVRRVSFKGKGKKGRWNTKKRRLLAREHIELMHVLAELGLEGRIRLIGADARQVGWRSVM